MNTSEHKLRQLKLENKLFSKNCQLTDNDYKQF